jgi:hypothetical protein
MLILKRWREIKIGQKWNVILHKSDWQKSQCDNTWQGYGETGIVCQYPINIL